jgi:tetratricopeptide (TPR) repeat protein
LFPRSLANDYSGPTIPVEQSLVAPLPLLGILVLGLIALVAIAPAFPFLRHRVNRRASFAAALFLLPYLVIGNLLFLVGAIFAERFLYLPALGFCLGAGLLVDRWRPPRFSMRVLGTALAIVLSAFAIRTVVRCIDWRDDVTIFAAAARVNPRSPRANYAFGKETAKKVLGRADRELAELALRQYDTALRLWPEFTIAWYEKGALLGQIGELPAAEAALREALRLNPSYASAHFNLGVALHLQKRTAEAERSLQKAVLWDPESDRAWAELGHVRYELGRMPAAAEAYRRAIALGRTDLRTRLESAELTP